MNFLSPINLLWLLPVSAVIVALYLLRIKRRDVTVSSLLLWQAVLQDTQANAPFQKLRRNLLLILQLLIALFLVLLLARPYRWSVGLGGKTTALVLDASASMKAEDEPGGRFAAAVRQARALIARKAPGDSVIVILASDRAVALSPLTSDRERLNRALDNAHPGDATGDMREAISFAASLVASRSGARVTVITDGAFGRVEEMSLGGATLGFVTVGRQDTRNVGITAFDVRETFGAGTGRQAFVSVQNFGPKAVTVPLEVVVNGRLTDAHALTLKPGESLSETFESVRADAGGLVQARLDIQDDLKADDVATVTLAPRRGLKILLVTEGNPFLERVLNTDTRVELNVVAPAAYRPSDSAGHNLTVFDDTPAPRGLKPGRYLFWGSLPADQNIAPAIRTGTDEAHSPQILDWSRTHPLMRFVDLANVRLLRAPVVAPAPWAQTLAETDAGPLIVAGERNDIRAVYVGFSLLQSDMPLRVAFPVFLSNCVRWLTARPGDSGGVTRPGEVVLLAATPEAGDLTVLRPHGEKDSVSNTRSTAPAYHRTDTVGVYRAEGKSFSQVFAVSMLSPAESNLRVVKSPVIPISDAPEKEPAKQPDLADTGVRREIGHWLIAVVLLFLCAEWWVYHRRLG